MNRICSIFSPLFAFLIVFQSAQFAIVSYFYANHNEVLVATCCKNKETDTSCKAKCFLDQTEKNQKKSDKLSFKKVEICNRPFTLDIQIRSVSFNQNVLATDRYSDLYFFLHDFDQIKPPSLA